METETSDIHKCNEKTSTDTSTVISRKVNHIYFEVIQYIFNLNYTMPLYGP